MPVEFDRGSPGKFDSRTLNRKTLNRWTGRKASSKSGSTVYFTYTVADVMYTTPSSPNKDLPIKDLRG